MAAEPLLELRGLRKAWPDGPALAYPPLRLEAGGLHVVVGANGAGKTTLLRLLAGLTAPEAGYELRWRGAARTALPVLGAEATLLQQRPYVFDVTAGGLLDLVRPPRPGLRERLLAGHPLAQLQQRPLRELSGGLQRQCALAAVALTAAPLVLLDEPAAGLDAAGRRYLDVVVAALREEGRTVLLAAQRDALPADPAGVIDLDEEHG
ncbi:MAG: ATP-binding cassette domain-containing protein [Betaproteobacteria bacterium AqS2]|uniref:ATP-binding cassette domain-containing protein n=1 Tax=Candidatus Amphirhobacter heronislandensis TaxID=1732024 RepID=A0A930XW29_9GAMM|nr:ATP-binding cassette domain-containing protein [Betaproteobacteria bacterium AqS2]